MLLKRLGNAVEANLAKNKLETAGIPSFLGGENAFAGDLMHPLPYREVELFVPQSMVAEALEVLDAPPEDPDELLGDPFVADAGQLWSSRAFVCAVVGWLVFFLAVYGFLLSAPTFAYAIFLSFRAVSASTDRSTSTIGKSIIALVLSMGGLVMAVAVAFTLRR